MRAHGLNTEDSALVLARTVEVVVVTAVTASERTASLDAPPHQYINVGPAATSSP